eukprot:gene23569-biopygen13379
MRRRRSHQREKDRMMTLQSRGRCQERKRCNTCIAISPIQVWTCKVWLTGPVISIVWIMLHPFWWKQIPAGKERRSAGGLQAEEEEWRRRCPTN